MNQIKTITANRLSLITILQWIFIGLLLMFSSYATNKFFYAKQISDFYFNLAFDLILVYLIGLRSLYIIFIVSSISTVLIWGHRWSVAPFFALPEMTFAAASYFLYIKFGRGDKTLGSLQSVIKFIVIGLLIPYLIQQVMLKEIVAFTGYLQRPSQYAESILVSLSGDIIPMMGISMPFIYFASSKAYPNINRNFIISQAILFFVIIVVRLTTRFESVWFVYGLIVLISSIRFGFEGSLVSLFLVMVGTFIIPEMTGYGIHDNTIQLPAIYLGNATLSIFAIVTGRTITDLWDSQKKFQEISKEKLETQQAIIKIQREQNEELEKRVKERTMEIQGMNDEMAAQNEELTNLTESVVIQRDTLIQQKQLIEEQHSLLQKSNEWLESKVKERTYQLEASNTELLRNNTQLIQLSYSISHNLRGPVATIMGLLNLLDKGRLDKSDAEIISNLEITSERLDSIIRDLNFIVQMQNDRVEQKREIWLEDEFSALYQQFEMEIHDQGIEIQADFSRAPTVIAIQSRLQNILYHLFRNALQYRSRHRQLKISLKSSRAGNNFILQITDNGLGIDLQKFQEKIFQPFMRFNYQTAGKGLGLFLSRYQAEMLGGELKVDSQVDNFTVFTLIIPY